MRSALTFLAASVLLCGATRAEFKFRAEEIETKLGVGYAVVLVDMNDDRKPDIVVVDTDRAHWYENPSWKRRTLIEGQTKKDNVCIAPYDIDGDGKLDFALGADWRPADTVGSGTLQWITRGKSADDRWAVHPIGQEPTVHRIRWADFDGDGRSELIVVPLFGRGSSAKSNYSERPLRILSYQVPSDPVKGPWKAEVISEDLHVSHNFHPADVNGDGKLDLLAASYEGVSLFQRSPQGKWSRELIGTGNQDNKAGSRGASEIKLGSLGGAGRESAKYIATIEPWHGNQVTVYTLDPPQVMRPRKWNRQVLDDQLKWGHAVWCANLDEDKEEELIIGVRDNQGTKFKCGVRIYDPQDPRGQKWQRSMLDPGGVAVEDLAAADLNGDGRIDIVAVGRATHNVKIYWNEKP